MKSLGSLFVFRRQLFSHVAVALFLVSALSLAHGFAFSRGACPSRHPASHSYRHSDTLFRASSSSDDSNDAMALNMVRTDVRNFLTQRAIQSFIFLLISCRDPHTVKWLENTYEFANMESFHGTGAFNLTKWATWDSILLDMLQRPKDVVIVSARRRGRGHGGWSKNNPHLEERFAEFEIDIDPVSLVSRIISVREQIAREWEMDLETMLRANDMILTSYKDNHLSAREEECKSDDEECVNVENLIAPYSDGGRRAFDRNAMMMLSNAIVFDERASSPYRKGNFDLLCLLVTQESVHRILREYRRAGKEREVSYEWFRDFYTCRVPSHFDGSQEYGRADDFLEELLKTPPSMKQSGRVVGLIDPLRIAEDVIRMRSQVAQDWKTIVIQAPQDHMGLRKELLAKQMGMSVNPSPFDTAPTTASSAGFEGLYEGGFE